MNSNDPTPVILVVFLLPLIFLVAGTWYGRSALGLRFGRALLFCVGATLGATVTILVPSLIRPHGVERGYGPFHDNGALRLVFADATIFLTLLLVAQLWQRWLGPRTTEEVKADGSPVWLTPGQGVLALLLAASASWGWDWSFAGVLMLALFALVAHPLYHHRLAQPASPSPEPVNSGEREKVLAMLDAGRITVTESAELLNALAASTPARVAVSATAMPVTGARRLMFAGAALVLVGFFLPWFTFNPGEQMQEMMDRVTPGGLILNLPQVTMNTFSVQVHGGDIGHGLGWLILLLGLVPVMLPLCPARAGGEGNWRRIAAIALCTGELVLLDLNHDTFLHPSNLGLGIIVVVTGYALETVGLLQSSSTPQAQK